MKKVTDKKWLKDIKKNYKKLTKVQRLRMLFK